MAEADDYIRAFLRQGASEEEFLGRFRRVEDGPTSQVAAPPPATPVVSLLITSRQRARLRELGFSDSAVRQMTPAEAHEHLGLLPPPSP